MKLVFASNNLNKIREIQQIVGGRHQIMPMSEAGVVEDIAEPFASFEENARAKAHYVFRKTGLPAFADDSGLEVEALDGAPGVFSARYAGEPKSDEANNTKLLAALQGVVNRSARFRTVIAWVDGKGFRFFEGTVEGDILHQPVGHAGFGYDPLFRPAGSQRSFAEFGPAEKDSISHRGRAMRLFLEFLKTVE